MLEAMWTEEAQVKVFQSGTVLATCLSCDIFSKNIIPIFYPCPKNLPEAKLKNNGLIFLSEEIWRQPNIDCVT